MLNQVVNVNVRDLIVKAHLRFEIIFMLMHLFLCIIFLCRDLSYNQLQNLSVGLFNNCAKLTEL